MIMKGGGELKMIMMLNIIANAKGDDADNEIGDKNH